MHAQSFRDRSLQDLGLWFGGSRGPFKGSIRVPLKGSIGLRFKSRRLNNYHYDSLGFSTIAIDL